MSTPPPHRSVVHTELFEVNIDPEVVKKARGLFLLGQYTQDVHEASLDIGSNTFRLGGERWEVVATEDLGLTLLMSEARYMLVSTVTVLPAYPLVEFAEKADWSESGAFVSAQAEQRRAAMNRLQPMLRKLERRHRA